jgi:hypothetical protein
MIIQTLDLLLKENQEVGSLGNGTRTGFEGLLCNIAYYS